MPWVVDKVQQFRARIVADAVHHAVAFGGQFHIQISIQNAFAFGQRWHNMTAFGRHHAGHTNIGQTLLQLRVIANRADLIFGQSAGCIDHVTSRFWRMETLICLPNMNPRSELANLGDVYLFVLRHQRIAGQGLCCSRHGSAPNGCFNHVQTCAIALVPDDAFLIGGRDLAPFQGNPPVSIKHDLCVLKRTVVALVHTQNGDNSAIAGQGCNCVRLR